MDLINLWDPQNSKLSTVMTLTIPENHKPLFNKIYESMADYAKYGHEFSPEYNQRDIDTWVAHGRPHQWFLVEVKDEIFVYEDRAYGLLAVVYKDKLESWISNAHVITHEDFVVVDKNYFSATKYIWQ